MTEWRQHHAMMVLERNWAGQASKPVSVNIRQRHPSPEGCFERSFDATAAKQLLLLLLLLLLRADALALWRRTRNAVDPGKWAAELPPSNAVNAQQLEELPSVIVIKAWVAGDLRAGQAEGGEMRGHATRWIRMCTKAWKRAMHMRMHGACACVGGWMSGWADCRSVAMQSAHPLHANQPKNPPTMMQLKGMQARTSVSR